MHIFGQSRENWAAVMLVKKRIMVKNFQNVGSPTYIFNRNENDLSIKTDHFLGT